jgi:hypothetical protein
MFKVQDTNFDINYAGISAYIDEENDNLVFGLLVMSKPNDNFPGRQSDFFLSDILLKFKQKEIKEWKDIAGEKVKWDEHPENDEEEPSAQYYSSTFSYVYDAKIKFKEKDGKMTVKIKAGTVICPHPGENEKMTRDFFYSNYKNAVLKIKTQVDFWGIKCGQETNEEECRNKIKPYLDISKLKFVKNEFGNTFLVPIDSDLETNMLVQGWEA